MIRKFRVFGNSMLPTYKNSDAVIALKFFWKLQTGDVVVLKNPQKNSRKTYIIKRIKEIRKQRSGKTEYFVIGDSPKESTDSRKFGWINRSQIVGKVIYKF